MLMHYIVFVYALLVSLSLLSDAVLQAGKIQIKDAFCSVAQCIPFYWRCGLCCCLLVVAVTAAVALHLVDSVSFAFVRSSLVEHSDMEA